VRIIGYLLLKLQMIFKSANNQQQALLFSDKQ